MCNVTVLYRPWGRLGGMHFFSVSGFTFSQPVKRFFKNITERKRFGKFFTSLVFVYKSMSLQRFLIEQLCPSIDTMISLVFVHYATM